MSKGLIKEQGRITYLNLQARYGFIVGEDGESLFFHQQGTVEPGFDVLKRGSLVSYVSFNTPRGMRAEKVRVIKEKSKDIE